MRPFMLLFLVMFVAVSCEGQVPEEEYEGSYDQEGEYYEEDEAVSEDNPCGLQDGTYSATVEYYNEHTEHEATYDLEVEVEGCEVTVIYWPSGGWSDDDHITPGEIDEDGYAHVDGEEGRSYEVYIDK